MLVIGCYGLYCSKSKIDWTKYLKGLTFCTLLGVSQILFLQNIGNVPAWYYPDSSALGRDWITWLLPNVCFEDVLFVPVCFTLFYYFAFLIRNVKDICSEWLFPISICFFVIETIVYHVGGTMARYMIVCYTMFPIVVILMVDRLRPMTLKKVNVTHMLLCVVFIIGFTAPWEFLNAWRHHWVYDTRCDLYSDEGWFLNNYLHISIFIQYAWSGAVVFLFSINYFGRDVPRETI